jgi:thiamine-phosphate pyrophosphorylase
MASNPRGRLPRLYAIVDPLDTGRSPVELAEAFLRGGARLLQLRLKPPWTTRDMLAAAARIRVLARAADALFVVNDRPDVARAVGADGVHLGQDDLPVAAARSVLGPGYLIGVSTHDLAQVQAAIDDQVDYIAVGPVYATTTKGDPLPGRGLELVRRARATVACPLVAIGGITPDRAAAVCAAGADTIAMIAALVRAPDVAAATADAIARLG